MSLDEQREARVNRPTKKQQEFYKFRQDPKIDIENCVGSECRMADISNFTKKRIVYKKPTSVPHNDEDDAKFKPITAFAALGIITLIRIATQWQ